MAPSSATTALRGARSARLRFMASISARMAPRSTEALGSARSRRMSSSLSARARTSSSNNCESGAAASLRGPPPSSFGASDGVQSPGSLGRLRGRVVEAAVRSPRPVAPAGLELVAAHGDLRHRGLEIKWRLRIERWRRREAIAARLASLSGAGQGSSGSIRAAARRRSAHGGRCLAPRRLALEFGRPFQRREPPALRRARASFQSARSPN